MPSSLTGPRGSRSPGRCLPTPLPPGRWSGGKGGSPGLTSSLLSTLAPGFPAPTPALGLSPPLPPPSSQPRTRLPSPPPPPSARRPSRPPLASAARLRVGRGGGRRKGSSCPHYCQVENSPGFPSAGIPSLLA